MNAITATIEAGGPPDGPPLTRWAIMEEMEPGTNIFVPVTDASGKALHRLRDRLKKRNIFISVFKEEGGHRVYRVEPKS